MIGHFPCKVPNSTAYWSNGLYASDDFVSWRYLGCTRSCTATARRPSAAEADARQQRALQRAAADACGGRRRPRRRGAGRRARDGAGRWVVGARLVERAARPRPVARRQGLGPVKQRRLLWLWGFVAGGEDALEPAALREHLPRHGKAVYAPYRGADETREGVVASLPRPAALRPAARPSTSAGAAVDVELRFAVPAAASTLAVAIGGAGSVYIGVRRRCPTLGGSYTVGVGFRSSQAEGPHYEDSCRSSAPTTTWRCGCSSTTGGGGFWQGGRVAMVLPAEPSEALHVARARRPPRSSTRARSRWVDYTTLAAVLVMGVSPAAPRTPRASPPRARRDPPDGRRGDRSGFRPYHGRLLPLDARQHRERLRRLDAAAAVGGGARRRRR